MQEDADTREALAAAGYTDTRGAALFCAFLAAVGAMTGSILFAILFLMLVPGLSDTDSIVMGTLTGALLGALLGVFKVRRGNREARELVDDQQWRREMRRHLGRVP